VEELEQAGLGAPPLPTLPANIDKAWWTLVWAQLWQQAQRMTWIQLCPLGSPSQMRIWRAPRFLPAACQLSVRLKLKAVQDVISGLRYNHTKEMYFNMTKVRSKWCADSLHLLHGCRPEFKR
jgi:hypothetical protein